MAVCFILTVGNAFSAETAIGKIVSFKSYQEILDNFLQMGIQMDPSPEYGINSLIVKLNRRLAKNPEDEDTLVYLGHLYRLLGQPQEAIRYYEKALLRKPEDYYLNIFSGLMHLKNGGYGPALEKFNRALSFSPPDADLWVMRGHIQLQLGNEEQAIQDFEKAMSLNPHSKDALLPLSVLYQAKGEAKKAVGMVEDFFTKHPQDLSIQQHLGALLLAGGNTPKAIEVWEGIYESGVRDPMFLLNLSIAYLKAENYDQAQKILDHLQFLFPKDIGPKFLLATIDQNLENWQEAAAKYREVLKLNPQFPAAQLGLALTLKAQGKTKESEETVKHLSHSPD